MPQGYYNPDTQKTAAGNTVTVADAPVFNTTKSTTKDLALKRNFDRPTPDSPSFQRWAQRRGYDPFADKKPAERALLNENPYSFQDEIAWKSRISRWQTVDTRLDEIERVTGAQLPTDLTLAMAESLIDAYDLHKAARLFARELSTPMSNVFQSVSVGNRSVWINPKTNKPLTLEAGRRLYKPYETKFYEKVLGSMEDVNPTEVAAWFRALAPLQGEELSWQDSLGAAIGLSQQMPTTAIKAFRGNLKLLAADPQLENPTDGSIVNELGKISVAFDAARMGIEFTNGNDVMSFLWGGPGPEPPVGTPEHAQWDDRKKLWEKWTGAQEQANQALDYARQYAETGQIVDPNAIPTVWVDKAYNGYQPQSAYDAAQLQSSQSSIGERLPVRWVPPTIEGQKGHYELTDNAAQLSDDVKVALEVAIRGKNASVDETEGYNEMIDRIKAKYVSDEEAWRNTIAGQALGAVGQLFDTAGDLVNAGLYEIGGALGIGARALTMPWTHETFEHMKWDANRRLSIAGEMLFDKSGDELTLAEALVHDVETSKFQPLLTEDGTAEPWVRLAFSATELSAQLALDPTNLLFGIGKLQKGAHLLTEAEKVDDVLSEMSGWEKALRGFAGGSDTLLAPTWKGRVFEWLRTPQSKLGDLTVPQWLRDTAIKYKDSPADFADAVSHKFRDPLGGQAIPKVLTDAIHEWTDTALRNGIRTTSELEDDIVDILATSMDVIPNRPITQFQDIIDGIKEGKRLGLNKTSAFPGPAPKRLSPGGGAPHWQGWMTDADAVKEADAFASKLRNHFLGNPDVQKPAIPYIRGSMADMRAASWKLLMDSRFGPGVRYRRSVLLSTAANLEKDFPTWVENYLNRAKGLFTRDEIAMKFREAAGFSQPFARSRETKFVKFIEDLGDEMVVRLAKKYRLSEVETQQYLDEFKQGIRQLNGHLYGLADNEIKDWQKLLDEGFHSVRQPLFATQLPNAWVAADPVRMAQMIQEGIGYKKRLVEMVRRTVGKDAADDVAVALAGGEVSALKHSATANWAVNSVSRWTREHYMRWWKTMVVATPRYMLRVPMFDEQLRMIADIGAVAFGSMRRSAAKAANLLGKERVVIEQDILDPTFLKALNKRLGDAGLVNLDEAVDALWLQKKGLGGDDLVARLEGLDAYDRQVLEDTLKFREDNAKTFGFVDKGLGDDRWMGVNVGTRTKHPRIFTQESMHKGNTVLPPGVTERELTVAHERAHSIHVGFWGRNKKARAEWDTVFATFSDSLPSNLEGNGAEEAFAELYGMYRLKPSYVIENWPDAAAYFKKYEKRLTTLAKEADKVPVASREAPKIKIVLPRSGEVADEAMANSSRLQDVFKVNEQQTGRVLEKMRRYSRDKAQFWDEVDPTDAGYSKNLAHVLINQVGRDEVGRRILDGIIRGKPTDDIIDEVVAYLSKNEFGKNIANRLGLKKADIEDHAETVERMIREWTMDEPALAQAALDGDADTILRVVDQWVQNDPGSLHPVHGFKADEAMGHGHPAAWAMDTYTKAIFEFPTNKLSRQPFFRHWYTEFKKGLTKSAVESGHTLEPELLRRIDAAARSHALERVQRVLFDFRRQSRFGEMLWFIAPFYQPWTEAFMVWGHLLRKNPQFANRARILYDQMRENNWIRTDPSTGETTLPLSNMWFMAPILNMAFGGMPSGEGFGLRGPLQSMNFIFGSVFEVPTGQLAGNIPIPLPSLNPSIMFAGQKLAQNDMVPDAWKWSYSKWAFQYGDNTANFFGSLLPTYVQHAIRGLPDDALAGAGGILKKAVGGENILKSQADDFLRLYEAQGLTPQRLASDPEFAQQMAGQNFKTVKDAQEYLANMATHQAQQLSEWRAVMSLFFPMAPSIQFPTEALELEYRRDITELGYDEGRDAFLKKHPENALITIGTTYWSREDSQVPLPANRMAAEILSQPGVEEFAKQNPQWVFALLPNEVWGADFDRALFFQQLASGERSIKGPMDLFNDADSSKGWQMYLDAKADHLAELEHLSARGINENDPTYMAKEAEFNEYVDAIKTLYPGFAEKIETFSTNNLDPWVEFNVDSALSSDLFKQTAVGQFIMDYRVLREGVMKQMADAGLHSLDTVTAKKLGLTREYNQGVKELISTYGNDAKRAYNYFFNDDLKAVVTDQDKLVDKLAKDPERYQKQLAWEVDWNAARMKAANTSNDAGASSAYLAMRDMANQAYQLYGRGNDNPLIFWWHTRTDYEKESYRNSVLTRPYLFLSRFERSVILEEPTSDRAEEMWMEVGKFDHYIAQQRQQDPNADVVPLYNARDRMIRDFSSESDVFAQQVHHANTWGYAFFKETSYAYRPGREGEAWRAFQDSLQSVQEVVNHRDLHGETDFGLRQEWYREAKSRLLGLVEYLKDYSPGFEDSWKTLEADSPGPDLLDEFMPDIYFRLGG